MQRLLSNTSDLGSGNYLAHFTIVDMTVERVPYRTAVIYENVMQRDHPGNQSPVQLYMHWRI